MDSEPLVSIIIPAYQAERTIAEAVKSLQAQTWSNWEAIIGSDDGMDYLEILSRQGLDTKRMRLKQAFTVGSGLGPSSARNAAQDRARGELLAHLDADDAYEPSRLAELVPLAIEHGVAIDNTGVYNNHRIRYKQPFPDRRALTWATADDILQPRIPFFPLYRRDLWRKGWTSVPFAGDVLFNLELLSRSGKMALHPQPLYRYYKRSGSITKSATAFESAERSYHQILSLLRSGQLDLTPTVRATALEVFSQNLSLNRVFRQYMETGRCHDLEEFLDITKNGRLVSTGADV